MLHDRPDRQGQGTDHHRQRNVVKECCTIAPIAKGRAQTIIVN
jgi:hypothetical protein